MVRPIARDALLAVLVVVAAVSTTAGRAASDGIANGTEIEEGRVEPAIVELPAMVLVGIADSAPDVSQLDIAAMWDRFTRSSEAVPHQVEGRGYEFHAQTAAEPCMHFCLTGVAVSELGDIPVEMFAKALPGCTYAVFTHRVVDGYAKTYERIGAWLESSEYAEAHPYDFQLYDSRFKGMDDPESEHDIYVPVRMES